MSVNCERFLHPREVGLNPQLVHLMDQDDDVVAEVLAQDFILLAFEFLGPNIAAEFLLDH